MLLCSRLFSPLLQSHIGAGLAPATHEGGNRAVWLEGNPCQGFPLASTQEHRQTGSVGKGKNCVQTIRLHE